MRHVSFILVNNVPFFTRVFHICKAAPKAVKLRDPSLTLFLFYTEKRSCRLLSIILLSLPVIVFLTQVEFSLDHLFIHIGSCSALSCWQYSLLV